MVIRVKHLDRTRSFAHDAEFKTECKGDEKRTRALTRVSFILSKKLDGQLAPGLLHYQCVQCDTEFTAVIYQGPNGPQIAVFSPVHGGPSTPNTPESVCCYLDEAHRARTVSAHAAAHAMYRAALDAVLFDQGYEEGMCGHKLNRLEEDIANKTAKSWADHIDTESLKILKDVANEVLHHNDKSAAMWLKLNSELVGKVMVLFKVLLYHVYEKSRIEQRLKSEVAAVLVNPSPEPGEQVPS